MSNELADIMKDNFLLNPPRWSGYSETQEALAIPSINTSLNAAWVSPSAQVVSDSDEFVHLFDYTTNPGSVTYIGDDDIIVECYGAISVSCSTNNVNSRLKWAKNGAPEDDPGRFIQRLIGTGADIGAVSSRRTFKLQKGDYIDFFVGADAVTTIYIEKAEWSIKAISKAYS